MPVSPGTWRIEGDSAIYQGATWAKTIVWTVSAVPVNLTGYTARMTLRSAYGGTEILKLETNPAPGGGVGNGRIVITPLTGTITLTITAADTALLTPRDVPTTPESVNGLGFYDLELCTGAIVEQLLRGPFVIEPEATT